MLDFFGLLSVVWCGCFLFVNKELGWCFLDVSCNGGYLLVVVC